MKEAFKKIIGMALAVLLCACVPFAALAADQSESARTVRVGVGFSNAFYLDEKGSPQGYCSHFIRQIAWLENWNLEYIPIDWSEGLEMIRSGELDLILPVQMSDERKEYLDFSKYSGGFESVGLYANADSDVSFNEYEVISGSCIGVEADNMCSQNLGSFAEEHGLNYTTKEFATAALLQQALEQGEVDFIVSSTMNEIPGSTLVAIIDYIPFYYCTAKGNTELMRELNDGMLETMTNNPSMALSVYEDTMKGTAELGYTKAEKEVIANTDKIVFAMYDDSLPLSGRDAEGNPIGIYVDLLKELEEISGITMEPYIVPVDEMIFDCLYDGTVNYIMCSNRLPYSMGDTSKLLGSDPIVEYTIVGVSKPENGPESTATPRIAIESNCAYLEENIAAQYPGATIQYYPTAKDCMAAVADDDADATFVNSWEYNYQSKNARFRSLMQWENTRISSSVIVVTMMGANDAWLNIVDKGFHKISDARKEEIIAQNVNMAYSSYDRADRLYDLWNSAKVVLAAAIFFAVVFGLYLYMRRQSIAALKEKNRELEQANSELEQANNAKSIFLSRMSHELRTPLNAISGYAQELENNASAPQYDAKTEQNAIAAIRRAVRYQLAIVGDLLNIHQIESGQVQLAKEEVDAATFMQGIVEMIQPEAAAKGIDFSYNRLTTTSESYKIDPMRAQQVLFNLLHNAIKFTPSGGTVRLTGEVTEQYENTVRLKFTVADTGIGMSQEFVETKLFQNFAQEYDGTTSPYEGCGIGLATCKELVRLMGGTITCESTQGKGSVFTVEIEAEGCPRGRRARRKREAVPCDLQGLHVLLCEDNPMNQDIEKRLLERMGCTVTVAENGKIGCELFGQSAPGAYSIVLMDIRMPEMDGLEATQAIRSMERSDAANVPIVAVSANSFPEDVEKSLAAGMNEHLAKPVDARVLHEKIAAYCGRGGAAG